MIAYVDASVLLRVGLRQPGALSEWRQIEQGISNLATALLCKEMSHADLTVATHDGALGLAARAHGLPVVGVARL